MYKKNNILGILIVFFLSVLWSIPAFSAATPVAVEYLCDLGASFYREGRYDDALKEFNKVLILDSSNQTARNYIENILEKKYPPETTAPSKAGSRDAAMDSTLSAFERITQKPVAPLPASQPKKTVSRESAMSNAFAQLKESGVERKTERPEKEDRKAGFEISGETQLSLGMTSEDVIWKQANADLNEKNWRVLSNAAYNHRENTYDTRVYDRLRVNVDTKNKAGFIFHSNITVDPWSFTGKSEKRTIGVGTAAGDSAEIELKYWSNTRYTINETIYTLRNGASISLPEIKVVDGRTQSVIPISNTWGEQLAVPQLKIDRQFQPLRELWFDYVQPDSFKIRFFPIAYQDQALTFDDPLRLSNNHIWWEGSPWLDRWLPGRTNPGAGPVDFTRGEWDDSLSFLTRDSDGTRLTALRGISLELNNDDFSLASTFATPKGLWQDYDSFDNLINATRFNYRLLDNLSLGSLFTYRAGFNENNKKDLANYVWGFDSGYEPLEGLKLSFEVATSRSRRDLTSPGYTSKSRGNAYYLSLVGAFPRKSLMDLEYGYYGIKPEESDTFFAKYRFYAARMDKGFDPTLSTYRQTRRDSFWSRHIHFRKPLDNYSAGLDKPSLEWEDIEPFGIGNGIDTGRDALGFRLETSLLDKRLDNLFDVRNVHNVTGKFIENVARDELTYKFNDKLTSKLLGIYHKLPGTVKGIDPFIYDTNSGIFLNNTSIEDGRSPSLKTGSFGLEYAFTEWLALSGIWERTNDYTLAYDNYPRGNLNDTSFTTFREFGSVFRREDPFLYNQTLFPLPPYPLYDIFKAGLRFEPLENLDIYLDYTRNEFKSAGLIDDNINHMGLEVAYTPTKKFGLYLRYTYSRWNDLTLMTQGASHYYLGHHNFYSEFRYLPSEDDELVLGYGESGRSPLAIVTFDPFGGSIATLDTQHIVRMYYRRKF